MRLFRSQKSGGSLSESHRDRASEAREETLPSQQTATPTAALADYNASVPAAWYPDPDDPTALRYWDGATWAERTQPLPPPPPPPAPPPPPPPQSQKAAESAIPHDATPQATSADDKAGEAAEGTGGPQDETQKDAGVWVGATETAVANALAVGTPEAWLNAAQSAVVVAEMAHTMQMATHARQIAEQATQGAQVATHEAQVLAQAAAQAMRTAEQTAQAAEVAAREARDAANAATSARQKAEQMAEAAPKAVDDAQVAVEAAANARAKAEKLDREVVKASQANSPEAWNEALRVVTAAWEKGTDHT
jgi:hypothetical protein